MVAKKDEHVGFLCSPKYNKDGKLIGECLGECSLEQSVNRHVSGSRPRQRCDPYASAVIELSEGNVSGFSAYLGKWMLMHNFEQEVVKYVVNKANDVSLTKQKTNRATTIISRWLTKSRGREDIERGVDMIFDSIEDLVSSKMMYVTANKLIRGSEPEELLVLEYCLRKLTGYKTLMQRLPDDIKDVFYGIVEQNIERNQKLPHAQRRRHDYLLGKALESFEQYTTRHNKETYGLVRKIEQKDTRNTLFDMYAAVSHLPRDLSQNVMTVIIRALDHLPDEGVMDDPMVQKVYQFVTTVSRVCN